MAIPTISPDQGVLGFRAYEAIAFQPGIFSDSTVTGWVATGLPAGLAIDATTGLISGSVAVPGYYDVGVVATNGTGPSAPVFFLFGILAADGTVVTPGSADVGIDINIDVVTRLASVANGGSGVVATAAPPAMSPLFSVKEGDTFLLNIRFQKNGVPLDPDPTGLSLAAKEFDTEGRIELASAFAKIGSGAAAVFKVPVPVTGAVIQSVLGNYDADSGTEFDAMAEIRWVQTVSIAGTTSLTATTQTFRFNLARDLTAD